MFKATVALLTLLVAGCTTPGQVGALDAAKIKSVIVVGAIQNELLLQFAGSTPANGTSQSVPSDWDVNAIARDQITQALRGHYEVRAFHYGDDAFRGVIDAPVRVPKNLTERLKAVVPADVADVIIVASATETGRVLVSSRRTAVEIGYWLTVYDGRTREPIVRAWVGLPCTRMVCLDGYDQPVEDLAVTWSGAPDGDLPPQVRAQVRSGIADLIARGTPNTLARLRLVGG